MDLVRYQYSKPAVDCESNFFPILYFSEHTNAVSCVVMDISINLANILYKRVGEDSVMSGMMSSNADLDWQGSIFPDGIPRQGAVPEPFANYAHPPVAMDYHQDHDAYNSHPTYAADTLITPLFPSAEFFPKICSPT
jgi:hypothetical protein